MAGRMRTGGHTAQGTEEGLRASREQVGQVHGRSRELGAGVQDRAGK